MPPRLTFPDAHLRAALPPEQFASEVLEIERELDQLHPPWRAPKATRAGRPGIVGTSGIPDTAIETLARVKWLLQRRKYLYDGHDYDVIVSHVERRDGSVRLLAHPIIPRRRHTPESIRAAARRSTLAEQVQQISLPQIAHQLQAPLELVERLALDAGPGVNLYAHVRRRLQEHAAAPPPEVQAPTPTKKRKA